MLQYLDFTKGFDSVAGWKIALISIGNLSWLKRLKQKDWQYIPLSRIVWELEYRLARVISLFMILKRK